MHVDSKSKNISFSLKEENNARNGCLWGWSRGALSLRPAWATLENFYPSLPLPPPGHKVSSPALTPSRPSHLHPYDQSQTHCSSLLMHGVCSTKCCSQWNMGLALQSATASEGQDQFCKDLSNLCDTKWLPRPWTFTWPLVIIGGSHGHWPLPLVG